MRKFILTSLLLLGVTGRIQTGEAAQKFEEAYKQLRDKQKYFLKDLAGKFPMTLCFLVHQLSHSLANPECNYNALLLYGPPGTGKTTIADKISIMAGSNLSAIFCCYHGHSLSRKRSKSKRRSSGEI